MSVPSLTDTQRRFLVAVSQRLPRERVQEVYLFSPLKQGGVETGVAVIASADHDLVAEPAAAEPAGSVTEEQATEDEATDGTEPAEGHDADAPVPGPGDGAVRAAEESDPTEAAARGDEPADGSGGEAADDAEGPDAVQEAATAEACVVVGEAVAEALESGDAAGAVEALAVEQPVHAIEGEPPAATGPDAVAPDVLAPDADAAAAATPAPVPAPRPSRFTIFTARYRLQLKGPDRGKWEVDVVEEADAPLITVDAVVRGVQRRAGELSAVERLSAADFAAALDEAPWLTR